MKKLALTSLLAVTVVLAGALPSDAGWGGHGGGHHGGVHPHHFGHRSLVIVGVGPSIWWGPWYYPPPYYVYSPPPVVVQEPPVYVQQPVAPAPQTDWYYCSSARNYYPNVPACPEPWIRVAPRDAVTPPR